jgi:CRISPR/Cas system-associated exonuclease Cas4 (RecB family)
MLADFIESPAIYHGRYVAKTLERQSETHAMAMGTLTHCAVLQGERLDSMLAVIPDSLLSEDGGLRTKAAKEWKAAQQAVLGVSVVTDSGVRVRLREDIFQRHGVAIETPFDWIDTESGFPMRAMPDAMVIIDGNAIVVDVKTIADINRAEFAIADSYWLQVAHYTEGVSTAHGIPTDRCLFLFVFVEKSAPYRTRVMQMSANMKAKALEEWRVAVSQLHDRITRDDWSDWRSGELIVVDRFIKGIA